MENISAEVEKRLLIVIKDFLIELGREQAYKTANRDSSLDHDLGIGSLERVELFRRIEKTFDIQLPDSVMNKADKIHELIMPILQANPPQKIWQVATKKISLEEAHLDPSATKTLGEVLFQYAEYDPQRPHIYLQNEQGNEDIISYGQLFEAAITVATNIVHRGIKRGETVAIMLPTSKDFFYAFFGTLFAGGIPVPIYPPFRADRIEEYAQREAVILRNAEARLMITFQQAEPLSKLLKAFIPSLKEVTTVNNLLKAQGSAPKIFMKAKDPALIQYTSGSTSDPKGVLLTHQNLLANIRAFGKAIAIKPSDIVVSWLPLYHDMGLIGTWLGSLYHGIPIVIMSPLLFLNRPQRWLWTIHYHRATISAGPNFAYELCLKKIEDYQIEGLDLSSWRLAFNGAEAIYPKTIRKFTERFENYGFKPEALFPVYGLAESSVALAFPPPGRKPFIDRIEREAFEKEQYAIAAAKDDNDILEFVCCGKALPEHETRIVDDKGNLLAERRIGNLQFKGPSAMQGYYRNPQASQAIYHEGWWDSGDLAYEANGEIFITGRKKDLIIKAGRNIHPEAVEEVASTIEGIRKGCVAAFGVSDPQQGTEKMIIVAETTEQQQAQREKIIAKIIEKVATALAIPPDEVILASPRTIPKTSSGKLRRSSCKQAYLRGKLTHKGLPFWAQLVKLSLQGAWKKTLRGIAYIGKVIYSFYATILLGMIIIPAWIASAFLSRRRASQLCHLLAKLITALSACEIKIHGKENLTKTQPMIYVANHASYVDALLLLAILPPDIAFVAKRELTKTPIIRTFIKRLGHLVVERLDFSKSLADTKNIHKTLEQQRSILIFPEGTFTYATGLRPFKFGAFKLAIETNTAICPIALQGTRNILRSDSYLLKPGIVNITIMPPVMPQGNDWQEVVRLCSTVRTDIAKHCGEAPLDLVVAGVEVKK